MKHRLVLAAWLALAALGCGSSAKAPTQPVVTGPPPRVWHDLGLTRSQSQVWALARHQGALFAGGAIHDALGYPSLGIARWDGRTWSAPSPMPTGTVEALASHGGELIAGGTFDNIEGDPGAKHILRWNGTSWNELGTGVSGSVLAMIPFGDDLIVAGRRHQGRGRCRHVERSGVETRG